MHESNTVKIIIRHRTNTQFSYEATLDTQLLTSSQKLKIGLKYLGICLVAALFFVLIPVLHFVLVPLALVVGIFLFFKSLSLSEFRPQCTIHCPQCKETFDLKEGPFTWPMKENCPHCRSEIVIETIKP